MLLRPHRRPTHRPESALRHSPTPQGFDVLRPDEIEATVAVLVNLTDVADHGRVYALLDPALERFAALDDEDKAGRGDP